MKRKEENMSFNTQNWRSTISKSAAEIKQEFDNISDTYDNKLERMDYRAPQDSAVILSRYLTQGDAHILDAGCGTGLVGEHLKQHGYTKITGVDISLNSLKQADKKNVYINTAKHNLLEPFPFAENTFSAITCIGVCSRFNEAEILSLLEEFERITVKGGITLISHRDDLLKAADFTDKINASRYKNLRLEEVTRPNTYMGLDQNYSDVKVRYLILRKT